MKTLKETVDKVAKRLEDVDHEVWTRTELEEYIEEGYEALVGETRCLWDITFAAENQPYCGNHVAKWEEEYMTDGDWIVGGVFNFTGGGPGSSPANWEREYVDNPVGPADHTNFWEHNEAYSVEYTSVDNIIATSELPRETLAVDRVTFDSYKVEPDFSKDLARHDRSYEFEQGSLRGYTLDKDGFMVFRKVPVPSQKGTAYGFVDGDDEAATYGTVRNQTDEELEADASYLGSFGVMRSVPTHFPSGQYGTIRRVYSDDMNVRVELFRFGKDLAGNPFEIPDRYVRYVELYAMSLAREREGVGQEKRLADHFMARYKEGVARLLKRRKSVMRERVNRMGGSGSRSGGWPATAQLPWPYPSTGNR